MPKRNDRSNQKSQSKKKTSNPKKEPREKTDGFNGTEQGRRRRSRRD